MTFLKNLSYVVLGAGLGIATVYLARRFLTSSSSDKKSKTNGIDIEDKSTKIYVIPYNKNTNKEKERKLQVSSVVVQNQNNEDPILNETVKTIIDGIALIQDQTKERSEITKENSIDPVYSEQYQNNEGPVNVENASENSAPFDRILAQNQINIELNSQEKEETVKETYERNNASIYLISASGDVNEREQEVSSLLVQNQSKEESTIDQTKNAVIDGIAYIQNQTKELLDSQEREKKSSDNNHSTQQQNNVVPVSEGNTAPINETPAQNPKVIVLNSGEKERTVKKTFVKKCGEEDVGAVCIETEEDNDWNVNFQSIKESSTRSEVNNNRFVSIPSEELANEKLNSTIYESFEDTTKYAPFKPPRIRKSSKSEVFERSHLNKDISVISSRKPSAQSTLLETHNKRIEVKESDKIKALAEESNIQNITFQSDNFIESRQKTPGHQLLRRYVSAFGNLFNSKKRASDRSKLLDSSYSTENYGNKNNLSDLIEDHEPYSKRYRKIK